MKDDARLRYEDMWTTDKDKYYLVETAPSDSGAFRAAIVVRESGGALVIDDDDDVLLELKVRMREAGVEVVTLEEAFQRNEVKLREWQESESDV